MQAVLKKDTKSSEEFLPFQDFCIQSFVVNILFVGFESQ
jgi:hypothetical protein